MRYTQKQFRPYIQPVSRFGDAEAPLMI